MKSEHRHELKTNELAEWIANFPTWAKENAKVLIASGYSANGPTKDALESGATGFISKPFDLKQILSAVRKALDGPTSVP